MSTFEDQLKATLTLIEKEWSPTFKAVVFLPAAHLVNLYHAVAELLKTKLILAQHSRQSQSKRVKVSNTFRDCSSGVLFATDVVARGMDFPNVSHVIQVGLPDSMETYIHRIGRTGRADSAGVGYLILAKPEKIFYDQLVSSGIPISEFRLNLTPSSAALQIQGIKKFEKEDSKNVTRVYQSWLGYYKTHMKTLRKKPVQIVEMANQFVMSLGRSQPPALERKTIGKMGLKGVPGLISE